jgi:hypothetical protein
MEMQEKRKQKMIETMNNLQNIKKPVSADLLTV